MTAIDFPNSPTVGQEFSTASTIYVWTGSYWQIKQPTLSPSSFSNSLPSMNGAAAAGVLSLASRSDHIHPVDTSRAPLNSPNFTGTVNFSGATVTGIDLLPLQTGNSGKYLTTNGTTASWATVEALPLQTGNSGKFLTTNGTAATWSTASPTITLGGDLDGSITLTDLAGGTLNATIKANSVELGTDTTGQYVASISGTTNQISASGSGTESVSISLSLPSSVVFPGTVTLNADPTQALQAATKQYVDAIAEGLHIHASCATATTANIANLSTPPATIDGVTLTTNMRVLVKNQSTTSQNGIYVFNGTALVRASDFDSAVEINGGDFVFITGGTTNDNTGWVQTETVVTVGSSPIVFTQFSGAGTYTAGNGLTLTGNQFTINTSVTADLSTTQTLTNKTISGANNTLSVRLANDITGFATNVATFLATPTSSNLAAAVTDETGTGSLVFSDGPTFTGTASFATILMSIADSTATASHYFMETASDGVIRPKTLANVRTEIVTDSAVQSAVVSPTAAGSTGVRDITISTSAATGGNDGDVWLTYV